MTAKPKVLPVQNMGHRVHGASRAFPSQVLRYGFRTAKGRTGGVSVEAVATVASAPRADRRLSFMMGVQRKTERSNADVSWRCEVGTWFYVNENPAKLNS